MIQSFVISCIFPQAANHSLPVAALLPWYAVSLDTTVLPGLAQGGDVRDSVTVNLMPVCDTDLPKEQEKKSGWLGMLILQREGRI